MERDPNCIRKDDHTYFPQENIQSCPRENVNVMREVWVSDVSSFSSMKNDSFTSKYSHANSSKIKTLINPKENDKLCSYNKSDCFMRLEQKIFLLDYDKKGSARSGFYGMLIILLVTISSMPLTLIPQHDILLYPKYWPESIFAPFAISAFLASNFVFDSFLILGSENLSPLKMFASLFFWNSIPRMILQLTINIVWIYAIEKSPPVPYIGYVTHTIGMLTISFGFWLQHSKIERKTRNFRKRFTWYLFMRLIRIVINTSYNFVAKMFEKVPPRFQVGLALVLPIMRYINSLIQHKMASKARGENETSAKFSISSNVACSHALQLAIVIGSSATNSTSIVICAIDVLLNLASCLKIVFLHKRKKDNADHEFITRLQALVIKETLELMLPISYCLVLIISFFGPNAEIMGNIKNDYWQYQKIENISIPLKKIGLFLIADIVRVTISTLILKIYCKIDFLLEYSRLMAVYWKPITTTIAAYIIGVSL